MNGDVRRSAWVVMPGTCGELVQGALDGVPCLVSCPIDCFSGARVELLPNTGWDTPCDAPKAAAALKAGLAHMRRPGLGGRLRLDSRLPRGRGYASSTADVGAALYALARTLDSPLTEVEAARLAVGVEPTDSTVFRGLTLFDHRRGNFHEFLGEAPPLAVLVLDPGGEVDTLHFNRQDHARTLRQAASLHREAFELLRDGLARGDHAAVGEAATLSSRTHQAILPHPLLGRVLGLARHVSGLGVCRAHSGTIFGILADPGTVDVPAAVVFLARALGESVAVSAHRLVGGGPRMKEEGDPAP